MATMRGKKVPAKKMVGKGAMKESKAEKKAEGKIEAAENKLAKKLPPADRKKFAAVQKREMKMDSKE